jgi:dephospho-CoA kinase
MHMRILGRANQRYALLFRDYLRAHPLAAGGYAALKRVLAECHATDADAYTLIKVPVCDVVMEAAEEWARDTG